MNYPVGIPASFAFGECQEKINLKWEFDGISLITPVIL